MTTMALYHFWHFLKLGGKATSPFEFPNTWLESIGQILVHLPVSDFLVIAAIYCRARASK